MKSILRLLVVLFATGTVGQLYAAPPTKPKIPATVVYIAIVSVDPTAMTITVEPRNSMSTRGQDVQGDGCEAVKVNGNPGTLTDLKPDMQIHFTLTADGTTATELSASRPSAGS